MLEIESLSKSFGNIKAVNDVSLNLEKGEAVGVLGPNGAGKTTLMSLIVGLTQPDSGSVRFADGSPTNAPSTRKRIGIAPQTISLYDEFSGQENLTFLAKLYGISGNQIRERVDWALEFAGLVDRRKHRVSTYSGGMKRRLNLASALIHEPELVLLDEPTVGVDPQSRNHLLESIAGLKQDGLTILYTTHYMEEAQRLCDRVAIIDHGTILANGTVDDLISDHGGVSVVQAELRTLPKPNIELPGRLDGASLRFECREPLQALGELTNRGIQFETLQLTSPDLETVFLSLTGRSLRDD